MRIGLVSADFYPNVGGIAAHVVELGRALSQQGHEVHVLTLPLGFERAAVSEFQGMTIHRPWIPRTKPFYSWLTHRYLRQFLIRQPLDVLHVHGLRPLEATKNLNLPVLFTNHSSGFLRRIQRGPAEHQRLAARLSHIAHVLAPSHELAQTTQMVGYPGPVTFISNGVDTSRFAPGPGLFRNDWGAGDQDVVILLARRLAEKNGVRIFAEALCQLSDRHLPLRVVFAGDGPEREAVQSILAAGGLTDSCIFLGNVPNSDMPEIYRSGDLSVLPSFMEATSITGLESMACGLPLIGTRVGGIPVLVKDNVTGLLVDPADPGQLAAAIERLVRDAALRKSMGRKALQRVRQRFDWQSIAAQTVEIYDRYTTSRAAA